MPRISETDLPRPNVTAPTKVEVPAARRPVKRGSRSPWLAIAIALGVAAIGVTAYFTLRGSRAEAPPPSDPYSLALVPYRAVIDKCAKDAGAPPPGARANVFVYPNGRVYEVAIEPAAMADGALGGCLRDALYAVRFPAAPTRTQVTLALTMR
jgi:hypothetical protein